ncbi:hypothetical protein TIFTF001_027368 [Ficus carica]|uniref:Uncharacterized protein n=1 Tax=Ficus carica TaxID=3494 RepID=A0AA88J064_FICCA|nr:hypothetical protein TIFTF001_027368 [Ficus carica]
MLNNDIYMVRVRLSFKSGLVHDFELDWAGRPNHSMAALHVVLAERKLTTYVYAVGGQGFGSVSEDSVDPLVFRPGQIWEEQPGGLTRILQQRNSVESLSPHGRQSVCTGHQHQEVEGRREGCRRKGQEAKEHALETLVGNSVVVGDREEGEAVRGVWVAKENMAVVEELEATTELRVTEQTNSRADPPSEICGPQERYGLPGQTCSGGPARVPPVVGLGGTMWYAGADMLRCTCYKYSSHTLDDILAWEPRFFSRWSVELGNDVIYRSKPGQSLWDIMN